MKDKGKTVGNGDSIRCVCGSQENAGPPVDSANGLSGSGSACFTWPIGNTRTWDYKCLDSEF